MRFTIAKHGLKYRIFDSTKPIWTPSIADCYSEDDANIVAKALELYYNQNHK